MRFTQGCAALWLLAATSTGCGTSPDQTRADATTDTELDTEDRHDATEAVDVDEAWLDASPNADAEPSAHADVDNGSDLGPLPDTESDVLIDPCDRFRLECLQSGQPVTSPVDLNGSRPAVTCVVIGGTQDYDYIWTLAYQDRPNNVSRSRSSDYRVGGGSPGEAQLFVEVDGCVFEGPEFVFLPPDDGVSAVVAWWPADEDARSRMGNEMDLHTLQSADACWFDPYQDLHFGSEEWLDWGVRFSRQDDPDRSRDAQGISDAEHVFASEIGAGEVWEVGVHARINPERPVPLVADVWISREGELLGRVRRTFTESAYWSVFLIGQEEFQQIDEVSAEVPVCVPREIPVCDGREATPEICNGIDDDCDGETDEYPEACYIGYGNYECIHFSESPDYPYRCMEI
jgi:hypothetical protein